MSRASSRRALVAAAIVALAAAALGGCSFAAFPPKDAAGPSGRADGATGFTDASSEDAGAPDATMSDAGARDGSADDRGAPGDGGGSLDALPPADASDRDDAGAAPDATEPDAAAPDATAPDASDDAGADGGPTATDAEPRDLGDHLDALPVDTGPRDLGVDPGADTGARDLGVDAGVRDLGVDSGADAGVRDLGVDTGVDTGVRDLGVDTGIDTGVRDLGVPDLGVLDLGVLDLGVPDTGAPDSGPVGCVGPARAPRAGELLINEIHADPAPDRQDGDANNDSARHEFDDEFVEIINIAGAPLDLTGVVLRDDVQIRHTFVPLTLDCNKAIVVFGGGTPGVRSWLPNWVVASTGSLILNNDGDRVSLGTSSQQPDNIASTTYGVEGGQDQSLVRAPEGRPTSAFFLHTQIPAANGARFSPGVRTDGTPF